MATMSECQRVRLHSDILTLSDNLIEKLFLLYCEIRTLSKIYKCYLFNNFCESNTILLNQCGRTGKL